MSICAAVKAIVWITISHGAGVVLGLSASSTPQSQGLVTLHLKKHW